VSATGEVGAGPVGVAGKDYPPVRFEIEAARVAAFATAIGADPASGVPPTFAAVYSLGATAPLLFADPDASIDFAKLLHAEQEFRWDRQPEVGETVVSRGHVASDVSRRGIRLVTFETETADVRGNAVCRSRALFVIRS
jgi:hypothetical protein